MVLQLLAAGAERHAASAAAGTPWQPPPPLVAKLQAAEGRLHGWQAIQRRLALRMGWACTALCWRSMELLW